MVELKWLIPILASVGVALLTLQGSKIDQIPWSRAFVIVGSLLLASLPMISYGKLGKDGLEVRSISETTSETIERLAVRVTTNEHNVRELQKISKELTSVVTNEQAKIKLETFSKTLSESVNATLATKKQFDDVKLRLDKHIMSLPKP